MLIPHKTSFRAIISGDHNYLVSADINTTRTTTLRILHTPLTRIDLPLATQLATTINTNLVS